MPSGALIASGGRTWPSPGRAVPRLRGLCVSGLDFSPSLSCRSCGRASPRGQMPVILLKSPQAVPGAEELYLIGRVLPPLVTAGDSSTCPSRGVFPTDFLEKAKQEA